MRFNQIFSLVFFALLTSVFFCGQAAAATEQDVLNFLREPIEINGEDHYVNNEYIVRAERFFNSHKYTPEEYDQILAKITAIEEIMMMEGVADPTAMDLQSQQKVLGLIDEAAEAANIVVEYGKTSSNQGYSIFYEKDGRKIDEIHYSDNNFKQTGLESGVKLGAGMLLTFLGMALWAYRRRLMA